MDLRILRVLVRCVNAREFFNNTLPCLFVCSFWVTLFADLHRAVNENLNKRIIITKVSGRLAIFSIRRNEGCQVDDTAVTKEICGLTDSAYILRTVVRGKAQVFIKTVPDIFAVEDIGVVTSFIK